MSGWMVRASKNGVLFDEFARGYVAMGWAVLGDLSLYPDQDALKAAYIAHYGNEKPAKTANAVSMLWRFAHVIDKDDIVLTYNPRDRIYLLGRDLGAYAHQAGIIEKYPNVRQVDWQGFVERDQLSSQSGHVLSGVLTLFKLPEPVLAELAQVKQPLEQQVQQLGLF